MSSCCDGKSGNGKQGTGNGSVTLRWRGPSHNRSLGASYDRSGVKATGAASAAFPVPRSLFPLHENP